MSDTPEVVEAVVIAVIPELQQAKVATKDGYQYLVTIRTPGVNVLELVEGQTLLCNVTQRLPRLLSARVLP